MKIGIKKNSKTSLKTKLATRVNLFLGRPLASVEQYRHAFKTQRSWDYRMTYFQRLWHWLTTRFFLELQGERAEVEFRGWVEMVSTEGHAKEAFFARRMNGLGLGEECVNIAALKWLSYLTDPNNAYHRKMVAKLADVWLEPTAWHLPHASKVHEMAVSRRMEFARHLLSVAQGETETRLAYCYIYNEYGRHGPFYRNAPEFKAAFKAIWKYCSNDACPLAA